MRCLECQNVTMPFLFFQPIVVQTDLCASQALRSNEKVTVIFPLSSDYVNGGELFTHLYQREHFKESQVRIYIGEIVLALDTLHKVCK